MRALRPILVALLLASGPLAAARQDDPALHFPSASRVLWSARSQVVGFELDTPATEDLEIATKSSDPGLLKVLRGGRVLAGERYGTVRVRALGEGRAQLRVGDAELAVEIRALPAQARSRRLGARITSPAAGAVVWGSIAIALEVVPGAAGSAVGAVRVTLDDGTPLELVSETPRHGGAVQRYVFRLDADAASPGPARLVACVESEDGTHVDSEEVAILIMHPAAEAIDVRECEALAELERPEAFGARVPGIGSSPDASGGGFVVHAYNEPLTLLPIELGSKGTFQLMVVARGDFGAGAFPSVGLVVDERNAQRTAARIVDHRFRRFPLGVPVALEAGEHTLGLRYLNDRTLSATSDRNLYLDRVELLRVGGESPAEDGELSMSMMSSTPMDEGRPLVGDARLWIALDRPLDGMPVNGELSIEAFTRWTGMEGETAAHVDLFLNGEEIASQHALRPRFLVDPGALIAGTNEIQLVASLPDGRRAETPVQRVRFDGDPGPHAPRAYWRFGVLDPRWDAGLREHLTGEGEEREHRVVRCRKNIRLRLTLPPELEGEFDLVLDARGPDGDKPPVVVRASIEGEGAPLSVGEAGVRHWWSPRDVGTLTLDAGEKALVLEIETESPRSPFWLRAVTLRAHRAAPDRTPPRARIVYPAAQHIVHGADAVVVEAFDDRALNAADLFVDGRSLGSSTRVPRGIGRLVLPLVPRVLSPGMHTLSVRVRDASGNVGETAELAFEVVAEEPAELGSYGRALRLLDRLAFGPDDRELGDLLVMGERAWLESRLASRGAGDEAALDFPRSLRGGLLYFDLERSMLAHSLRTPNPVRARLVAWIENHFSIWAQKVNQPTAWRTHVDWSELGLAPFGELLAHSATSAAMLAYLDQFQSYSARLNENYARELLELHTVGVDGGYTQEEVTALAGLLSGLTIANEAPLDGRGGYLRREFRYDPALGDGLSRRILGLELPACGPDERLDRLHLMLEHLAAHPMTARYIALEFARHYVAETPPEALVDDLAAVFLASGGDLREMLLALAAHPSFLDPALEERVATPLDYALRLGRATGLYVVDGALSDFLRRSGMGAFDRATPDGWPEDDAHWADTNAMLQRWRLVDKIPWGVRLLVPDELRRAPAGDEQAWMQRQLDVAAVRLTGRPLGESSNRAALESLIDSDVPGPWQRGDRAAAIVCRMPEASTR